MFHYNKKFNIETTKHSQITTIKQLHHHKTRFFSRNNYFLPHKRTEKGKQSLTFIGSKVWQEIPAHLNETRHLGTKHLGARTFGCEVIWAPSHLGTKCVAMHFLQSSFYYFKKILLTTFLQKFYTIFTTCY